jgi:hypothetical protein
MGSRKRPSHLKTKLWVFLCMVVVSIPGWLGSVWPLFTTKTIPEWLEEQRWPMISKVTTALITAIGLILFLAVIIWDAWQRPKPQAAAREPEPETKAPKPLPERGASQPSRTAFHITEADSGRGEDWHQQHTRFFRVKVGHDHPGNGVTGCHGRIIKIEKRGEVLKEEIPHQLPFAPCQNPDSVRKIIHANTTENLDVLAVIYTAEHHQVVHIPTGGCKLETLWVDNRTLVFQEAGCHYMLTVRVQGDGAQGTQKLQFRWTGKHETSRLIPYQPANPETLRQMANDFQAEARAIAVWPDNRDSGFLQRYGECRHRMNALVRSLDEIDPEQRAAIQPIWLEFTNNDCQLDGALLWKIKNVTFSSALLKMADKLRQ